MLYYNILWHNITICYAGAAGEAVGQPVPAPQGQPGKTNKQHIQITIAAES